MSTRTRLHEGRWTFLADCDGCHRWTKEYYTGDKLRSALFAMGWVKETIIDTMKHPPGRVKVTINCSACAGTRVTL